ncbi:MAG: ChaB family protein [Geodermatophilaceae bacterium]
MPKTTKTGKAKADELPSTVARSDKHAQQTFAKVHDSAAEQYGDPGRAHQVAFAALKHAYEKVGDHWERKEDGKKGPSDARAEQGGPNPSAPTAGGVDAKASKKHLAEIAKRLDVPGRSRMTKDELVEAIQRANDRETAKARS